MYVSIKGNIFVELLWRQRFFFIWSDRLGQGLAILRVTSAVVGQREATSLKLHSRVLTVISLTNATTNLAEWSSWDVGEVQRNNQGRSLQRNKNTNNLN